MLELGQRLQAEDHNRQEDHEHGDYGDHPGTLRALWVLEQQPDFPLKLVRRQRLLLLLDEAFVLPVLKQSVCFVNFRQLFSQIFL